MKCLFRSLFLGLSSMVWLVGQPQSSVALNLPVTVTADILVGSAGVDLALPVSGCSSVRVDLIVPVNGAQFSLLNPSNAIILASGDPSVQFLAGSVVQPTSSLPGGIFATGEIPNPANGNWTARLIFPTVAPARTIAMATLFCVSRYQTGIAIERNRFLVGEDVSIGMLVLDNNISVSNLTPMITVRPIAGGAGATQVGLDNGLGADGKAGDGLYSIDHTFTQAGRFRIDGRVDILGTVKDATFEVTVVAVPLTVAQVTFSTSTGAGGCVSALNAVVNTAVNRQGTYASRARLTATNGLSILGSLVSTLTGGNNTMTISFPAEQLRTLGVNGPYMLSYFEIDEQANGALELAFKRQNVATSPPVNLNQVCSAPVEILPGLMAAQTLSNGLIGSFNLSLNILTQSGGSYAVSFKLTGSAGQDLGLFSGNRTLTAGAPTAVTFTVPAAAFLAADGPYSVTSVLVSGPGGAAQSSSVGATAPLLRWQFKPAVWGDLDNDGDIDATDRTIQLSFRNQTAVTPGDRRDLNRDGRIDILDLRAITALVCAAGSCPVF